MIGEQNKHICWVREAFSDEIAFTAGVCIMSALLNVGQM